MNGNGISAFYSGRYIFAAGTFYDTRSYGDDDVSIFSYPAEYYGDRTFWSGNFLMGYLILTLVAWPVFLFKGMRYL